MKKKTLPIIVSVCAVLTLSAALLGTASGFKIDLGGGDFVVISLDTEDAGILVTKGPNGSDNIFLGSLNSGGDPFPNNGIVSVEDASGESRARLFVDRVGEGGLELDSSRGDLGVYAFISSADAGTIQTYGPNGQLNADVTTLGGNPNHAWIDVSDANGSSQAGMYVDSNGNGVLFGDLKPFVEDYPGRPDLKIVYVSLEGPEAAMYHRGRADLINGRALVELPDHFTALAALDTATVQLTPHAATSQGLAVASLQGGVLEIVELNGGGGSYPVSYIVHAARERFRDHTVIRRDPDVRGGARDSDDYPLLDKPSISEPPPEKNL